MCQLLRGISVALILAAVCLCVQPSWGGEVQINGAGATFPEPFYFKAFDAYYSWRRVEAKKKSTQNFSANCCKSARSGEGCLPAFKSNKVTKAEGRSCL